MDTVSLKGNGDITTNITTINNNNHLGCGQGMLLASIMFNNKHSGAANLL